MTEIHRVSVGSEVTANGTRKPVVSELPLTREEVEELVRQHNGPGGLDLSGRNLSFTDLSGMQLNGVVLTGASLRSARLRGASLQEADLSQAELVGADMREAELTGADLHEADLRQANLDRAHMAEVNLQQSDLSYASAVEAHLEGAALRGAKLTEVSLQRAFLASCDLKEADLTSANLQGARLTMADLSGADLKGAYLENTLCVRTRFVGADLTGSHLAGAYLNGAELNLSTAFAADMAGAHIEFVNWDRGYVLGDEKGRNYADAEAAYRGFRRRYDELGMHDHAREFFLREMIARRKAMWWGPGGSHSLREGLRTFQPKLVLRALWPHHPFGWAVSLLVDVVSGYGERPFRLIFWMAATVLGLAALYYYTASITPTTLTNALYFSAASFTALGYALFEGQASPLARGLGAAEAFLGLFLMALFLVTFVRRMTR
ncbi:MAG: pentapeptide repeat-containing protein [Chloroflexi bacterium]|nr:pentapeptide repeat-containing protein [Chloroflexota bacterium]